MNRRWVVAALGGCLFLAMPTWAQEVKRIEFEKLAKITKPVIEATAKLADLPHAFALDGDKGMGLEHRHIALLVIPDAKLTPEALARIDKEIVPLGVLYCHKVTPVAAGEPVASERHRTVEVTVGDQAASFNALPLAVARVAGKLVLLTYTNKKEPTLVAELVEAEESKAALLDLEVRSAGDGRAILTINVLSKYRAVMTLAGQE